MKISVLIPTRDRLPLLRRAVDSVLRHEAQDWEIVISDNASAEDVAGYVRSLDDTRIVYVRTARPLAVTENWNNALAHSSGDYVLMLGDDDAVLPAYFSNVQSLIGDFDQPQVIYHNALVYAYPGVVPAEPDGYLRSEGYAEFLRGAREPFALQRERAQAVVRAAMGFKLRYGFNMQFATVARPLIEELSRSGPFYRSRFPDYYAMNNVFQRARSIVVDPRPAVVIGVSPRSYGFFHNNNAEKAGRAFLQASEDDSRARSGEQPLLPGTNINDGWLDAMRELHRELGCPRDLRPRYRRYRMLQIVHVYDGRYLRSSISQAELEELQGFMSWRERMIYGGVFSLLRAIVKLAPVRAAALVPHALALIQRQFPAWDPVHDDGRYENISEVVARVDASVDPARWQRPRHSGLRAAVVQRLS
jgi:glycosyltransferase involved in cell wall biosynthesis